MVFCKLSIFVQINNNPSLQLDKQLTVSFWAKPDTNGSLEALSKDNLNSYRFYAPWSGGVRFRVNTSTGSHYIDSQTDIKADEWVHIVGTYDSTKTTDNFALYINGELDTMRTISGDINVGNGDLLFGKTYSYDSGTEYKGEFDEINIYDRAIDGSEVDKLFNSNESGENVVASWSFDNQNTLTDDSGDNDGTYVGSDQLKTSTGVFDNLNVNTGINSNDRLNIGIKNFDLSSLNKNVSQLSLEDIDSSLNSLLSTQSEIGVNLNRLSFMEQNNNISLTNNSESLSRIQDLDFASTSSELVKNEILIQSTNRMLNISNSHRQNAVSLLTQ